jgi:hypothetical protein
MVLYQVLDMKLADRPAAMLAVLVDLVLIGTQLRLYVSLVSSRHELHKGIPVGRSVGLLFVCLYFVFREAFQMKTMCRLGTESYDEFTRSNCTSDVGKHNLYVPNQGWPKNTGVTGGIGNILHSSSLGTQTTHNLIQFIQQV